VHITGNEIGVIDVAIGGVLGWGGGAWTQWRSSRTARLDARSDRCRDSYAALILALDYLERAWTASETLEPDDRVRTMGEITGKSIREIHQAYVTVLLAGSEEARNRAKTARNVAWDLNDRLQGRGDELNLDQLGRLFAAFSDAARSFVQLAEHELA
jgi:hypothetical protein